MASRCPAPNRRAAPERLFRLPVNAGQKPRSDLFFLSVPGLVPAGEGHEGGSRAGFFSNRPRICAECAFFRGMNAPDQGIQYILKSEYE
jgi:hypothetical protein